MTNDDQSDTVMLSLQSITRGAGLFFIGSIISNALSLFINLFLTRGLGPSLYGIYAYGNTIISIILSISLLGTGKSILRFLPEYEKTTAKQNAVLGLAYLTALISSIIMGLVLYSIAPFITKLTLENPILTDVLRILALILPFNTLANLTNSVFRGIERLEYQVAIDNIVLPSVRILFIGAALLLGYSLIGVMIAVAAATVFVFMVAILALLTKTDLRPKITKPYNQKRRFYNFSLPLTLRDMGSILYNRVDILMVGFFLADSSVGIYKIAIVLATVLVIPLGGFNQIFVPVASRLYSKNEMEELELVFAIVTRWTLTLAFVPALGMIIYRREVLTFFGDEFTTGGTVLLLVAIAQLTNIATGPNDSVLMMTNHQYMTLANQWAIGILNAVFNYIFILQFGLIGAALATASVLAGMNIIRMGELWYLERLFPYSFEFWKPLTAAIGSGLVMVSWGFVANGYALIIVGGSSGLLTYVVLLYLFGIETNDREFFEKILADFG